MNTAEIQTLIEFYRTQQPIFAMPAVMKDVPCGTAYCLAGQICVNHHYRLLAARCGASAFAESVSGGGDALDVATEILGLTYAESLRLFIKSRWPDQFRNQPDSPGLAVDRLEHFLATKGHE